MLDFIIDYFDEIMWVFIIGLSILAISLASTVTAADLNEAWDMVCFYWEFPEKMAQAVNKATDALRMIQ